MKLGSALINWFCLLPPGDINGARAGVPRIQRVSADAAHSAAGEEEVDSIKPGNIQSDFTR